MALDHHRPVQAAVVADAQPHVVRILDRHEIEMLAPDEGHQRLQEPLARGQIAAAGTGLDIGRPFPGAADAFVIALGRGHRETDRRHRRIGAQPQVGAEDVALGGEVGQKGGHPARHADEGGAGLLLLPRIARLVEEADEVDVGGIVELSRPHLAHGERDHAARRLGILGRGAGQLAAPDLVGHEPLQRKVGRPVGEPRQCGGHRLERPDAAQIGQSGQKRRAPLGDAQPVAQRGERQISQRVEDPVERGFGGLRQRLAQPGSLADHEAAQVGAATGGGAQKARKGRIQIGEARGDVDRGVGLVGQGLAG